jgi:ABC-type dipeptide/oligopeptide/nickel transport system permease component
MTCLYATLHTLGVSLRDRVEAARRDAERGASTIEIVFWAVALLALAGLVYAAISAYINRKIPGIT